ncbi:AAA family ATPase [Elusimicrobiota bacterium]
MPASTGEFLTAVFPSGSGFLEIFFLRADKKKNQHIFLRNLGKINWASALKMNGTGHHVYFGPGARSKEDGHEEFVTSVAALWVDLDAKDFDPLANPDLKKNPHFSLEAVENGRRLAREALVSRLPADLQPSIIVDTGNGYQAYWLLLDPIMLDEKQVRAGVKAMVKKLGRMLNGDSVSNLNRFLRVPGTTNVKPPPLTHKPCTIIEADYGRRFDISDLEDFLTSASPPSVAEPSTPAATLGTSSPSPMVADLDRLGVSTKIKFLIVSGKTDGDHYSSRSEADAAVITALINAGHSNDQIRAVFSNPAWGIGQKYRRNGNGYLDVSISKSREFAAANPPPARALRATNPAPSNPQTVEVFSRPLSEMLDEEHIPAPEYLVEPLILQGSIGFIAAEPKMMKTWITLDIAFNVALGKPVLGHFEVPQPRKVLLVQEEDAAAAVRGRLQVLSIGAGGAWPEDGNFRWAIRSGIEIFPAKPPPENVNAQFRGLVRDVERHRPDLLVIDALNRIHSGDENQQRDMAPVMRHFEHLRRSFGCAILVVHHFRKGSREKSGRGNQRLRGSSALGAWAENSLYIMSKARDNSIVIAPESKHDLIDEFGVRLEEVIDGDRAGARFVYLKDPSRSRKAGNVEKVFKAVLELHGELPATATIANIHQRIGLSESTIRGHLDTLEDEGRITKAEDQIGGAGQHKFLFTPVTPRSPSRGSIGSKS